MGRKSRQKRERRKARQDKPVPVFVLTEKGELLADEGNRELSGDLPGMPRLSRLLNELFTRAAQGIPSNGNLVREGADPINRHTGDLA
jgi:hypothetical protein